MQIKELKNPLGQHVNEKLMIGYQRAFSHLENFKETGKDFPSILLLADVRMAERSKALRSGRSLHSVGVGSNSAPDKCFI